MSWYSSRLALYMWVSGVGLSQKFCPSFLWHLNGAFCLVQESMSCFCPTDKRLLTGSWAQDFPGIEVFFCFGLSPFSQWQWIFICAPVQQSLLPFPSGLRGKESRCNCAFPSAMLLPLPRPAPQRRAYSASCPTFSPFSSNGWRLMKKSLQGGVKSACICKSQSAILSC